jgi:hypothetical protein
MEDMFGNVPQPERQAPRQREPLTAADIREQMLALIVALRRADEMPFEPTEMKKRIAMFPIMAQWLAPEEGEQLVLQFEAEVERLRLAA